MRTLFSIMEIKRFMSSALLNALSACSLVIQIFSRKVVFMLKYLAYTVGALSKSQISEKSGFCVSVSCHALFTSKSPTSQRTFSRMLPYVQESRISPRSSGVYTLVSNTVFPTLSIILPTYLSKFSPHCVELVIVRPTSTILERFSVTISLSPIISAYTLLSIVAI